jgi:hypothetical protein
MVTIRLVGQKIQIEPPQHLAVLEIVRDSDGASVKVVHQTGYETESDFRLVWRSPGLSAPTPVGEEGFEMPGVPQIFLSAFPLVEEVDLRELPPEYRKLPHTADFELKVGERYSVLIVGGIMVQTTLVAT